MMTISCKWHCVMGNPCRTLQNSPHCLLIAMHAHEKMFPSLLLPGLLGVLPRVHWGFMASTP